jgi:hypothetical protein
MKGTMATLTAKNRRIKSKHFNNRAISNGRPEPRVIVNS